MYGIDQSGKKGRETRVIHSLIHEMAERACSEDDEGIRAHLINNMFLDVYIEHR